MAGQPAPALIPQAFAASGVYNPIPLASQSGVGLGNGASYHDGFPPITLLPINSGGLPPLGPDLNGILNQVTSNLAAICAGQYPVFNSTIASAIGGYAYGAVLASRSGQGAWFNTVAANTTDPDGSGASGWIPYAGITQTAAEAANGITPTATIYPPGNPLRYGADPTGASDSTTALQNCVKCSPITTIPPGVYTFSTLTIPTRGSIFQGSGTHTALVHTGSGVAIACADTSNTLYPGNAAVAYVQDGQFTLRDFSLYTNGTIGVTMAQTRSSVSNIERVYFRPYAYYTTRTNSTYASGQTAVSVDNNPWSGADATYTIRVVGCTFSGYQNNIVLNETVNVFEIDDCYSIDSLNFLNLSSNPGSYPGVGLVKLLNSYHESNVAGAIGVVFGIGGGNVVTIQNCGFELTNTTSGGTNYPFDFSHGGLWQQVTVIGCKYLVYGDGNGVNNRRIKGTPPLQFTEYNRTYTSSVYGAIPMDWAPGSQPSTPCQKPTNVRFGGFSQGNGSIYLGRGDTDGADSLIAQDNSGNLTMQAYGDVRLESGVPAFGVSFTTYAVTFTAAPTGNAGTLAANWTNASGTYQVAFSDGETRNVTFTNGATTATWNSQSPLTGAPTAGGNTACSVANGATSGTLTANWTGVTGAANATFADGEVRSVTFTNGSASVTWSGAVSACGAALSVGGITSGSGWAMNVGGANALYPLQDNTYSVGTSTKSCTAVYSHAFNTVSDAREKDAIGDIDPAALRAWSRVNFRQWKWRNGVDTRMHFGVIAQEVISAFEAEGLDARAFGIVQNDPEGDRYTVSMTECLALECACLRGRMDYLLRTNLGVNDGGV